MHRSVRGGARSRKKMCSNNGSSRSGEIVMNRSRSAHELDTTSVLRRLNGRENRRPGPNGGKRHCSRAGLRQPKVDYDNRVSIIVGEDKEHNSEVGRVNNKKTGR
ncbi:hypothetical protein GWI33_001118 [Rhynchophorus ferrugineus]|uniref:Uncharacterized protein n=1 Tax=Rhynchophorus ferrugineus TaxID=354439 RepID=A0A834HN89_RHYFE|nr:hypothetical protein GWI33_001118 [Rhynchophorus ferrugineus]